MSLVHAYAKVIQDADKKGAGEGFFKKLISFMKARGHLSLLREIIRVIEREPREPKALVSLARESDAGKFSFSLADHLKRFGVEKGEYIVRIDSDMVGGYRIKAGNRLLDRSFRSALVSIYQNTTR